jgi:hypothetical protein
MYARSWLDSVKNEAISNHILCCPHLACRSTHQPGKSQHTRR